MDTPWITLNRLEVSYTIQFTCYCHYTSLNVSNIRNDVLWVQDNHKSRCNQSMYYTAVFSIFQPCSSIWVSIFTPLTFELPLFTVTVLQSLDSKEGIMIKGKPCRQDSLEYYLLKLLLVWTFLLLLHLISIQFFLRLSSHSPKVTLLKINCKYNEKKSIKIAW